MSNITWLVELQAIPFNHTHPQVVSTSNLHSFLYRDKHNSVHTAPESSYSTQEVMSIYREHEGKKLVYYKRGVLCPWHISAQLIPLIPAELEVVLVP